MFDKFRLKDVLAHYKQNFASTQWGNEKYKWEAVKWFQGNWDVNAQNFPEMLSRSLDKTFNLLASINNFPRRMIVSFSKAAPEEVRAMFIALFDENKDVYERINAFKLQSSILLERYGNGAAQHYQYENAISTYLWLRYPDKYYIYKFGEVKNVANELETDYRFKKGAYADNIRNFLRLYNEISLALKEDTELVNLFQSQLTDTCYPDPELKTLTIDVGFYISRFYSQQDENAEAATEWYGTDYNPGLTIENWKKLLKDGAIFTTSALEIMKRIKDYGGQASCTQLAVKYGETKNFYNSGSVALAHRVCEAAGIKPATREDGSAQWWTVLYTGRDADKGEDGSFIWKLRDELSEALDQTDLSKRLATNQLVLTVGYDIENLKGTVYTGEVTTDRYGRKIPKHAHGTVNLDGYTSSGEELLKAATSLYDRIVDKTLLARRLTLCANHLLDESSVPEDLPEQIDLFTDYSAKEKQKKEADTAHARERKLQETMLDIKKRFGKNAILKGLNLEDGATARERNNQIGGHKA